MNNYLLHSATAALGGILFVTGCAVNPVTQTTDSADGITVSAESVGTLTFQSIDEAQLAENLLALENPAPENLFALSSLPDVASDAGSGLGKKSASTAFSIDTIDGKIRLAWTTPLPAATKYDTTEVVMDATVFDGIDGNESIVGLHGSIVHTNGTTDYYAIEDRDGDNIINGTTAGQKAAFTSTTVFTENALGHSAGESVEFSFEVGAGDDNDFGDDNNTAARADNLIYRAAWVRMLDGDSISYAFYEDADGDGVIAATGEGTMDVRFFEKDNPLKPLVDYGKAILRIERDARDVERTVRLAAEEKLVTGRLNRVWVVDESGDSTISAGETALVHFATNSPAVADSETTAQAVITVDPGQNLGEESDNRLRGLLLAKSYRFGVLDSMQFSCTFDPAVPHGEEPTAGSFELQAIYRNGKTASLAGTFENDVINATYTGPEGNEQEVVLDR